MANKLLLLSFIFLLCGISVSVSNARLWRSSSSIIRLPVEKDDEENLGKKWALLIAGSSGFANYRHQADVCHAYHVLKDGGLKDENIIVFMFDDIANDPENPRPGMIINHPNGSDVYQGVPKDYTGANVNVQNLFGVILGDKKHVSGGSGKVLDSGPNDHIFIYYSDHGGPGVLGMPNTPYLYAHDFVDVLKKKHAANGFKEMVIYLEACESGSMFEGLLPQDLNIYVTTAANSEESSWGTYCPGMSPPPPPEYFTCLGLLYSVAWMEDSEKHNLKTETLKQQYQLVKARTSDYYTYKSGSHVMQYGDISMSEEPLFLYMGTNPPNANSTFEQRNDLPDLSIAAKAVNQRDADLLYAWQKYERSSYHSEAKSEAHRQLVDMLAHRLHVDQSIDLIGKLLFGSLKGPSVLQTVRPHGQPLVDDWDCLKSMVRSFETYCGSLSQYGMRHMRSLANICNEGISPSTMKAVSSQACSHIAINPGTSIHRGFSA